MILTGNILSLFLKKHFRENFSPDIFSYKFNFSCCMKYAFITDNHTPESILHFPIEKGAVYFADRVYGKAKQLQHIINSNADFVIRVSPFHIKLFKDSQCKEKLNLYDLSENEVYFQEYGYLL